MRALLLILMVCLVPPAAASVGDPERLQLLGRSTVEGYKVHLDEQDRQWLRNKGVLRLGVSGPDYPPFEVKRNHDELEGITADYAVLVAQLLNVQIEVLRYVTREAAMEALKFGELDALGTSNNFELADSELILSSAYAD